MQEEMNQEEPDPEEERENNKPDEQEGHPAQVT